MSATKCRYCGRGEPGDEGFFVIGGKLRPDQIHETVFGSDDVVEMLAEGAFYHEDCFLAHLVENAGPDVVLKIRDLMRSY